MHSTIHHHGAWWQIWNCYMLSLILQTPNKKIDAISGLTSMINIRGWLISTGLYVRQALLLTVLSDC